MKIGILGIRGIPNAYGGFEQFATYLSIGLVKKGHRVFVYNSSLHPYQQKQWQGVNIIHCRDWENKLQTAGQLIYDFNCIEDARKKDYDVLLQLGYTSNSVWYWRWPKNSINVVNMDGLEWTRKKYSRPARAFLHKAEAWAALHADHLIADSPVIEKYLINRYKKKPTYIPYAAEIFNDGDASLLATFQLQPWQYYLVVCRMEPENNIELIINGYLKSRQHYPLIIVGNTTNSFGKRLTRLYSNERIRFTQFIADQAVLNNLRFFSAIYFHGHSAGGTNPSLLEAMACHCNIAAHENIFNKAVVMDNANYFSKPADVTDIINNPARENANKLRQEKNLERIRTEYNWDKVIDQYETLFYTALSRGKTETRVALANS